MKKFFLAAISFLPCLTFAQTPEIKSPVKLHVGFTFSPDLGHREITYFNTGAIWQTNKTEEKVAFGFTAGPRVLLQLTNRFSLESGLLFADKASRSKLVYTGMSGNNNEPVNGDHKYHALFLDIPAKVNYYLFNQKIKVFLTTGTAANFFLNEKNDAVFMYKDGSTVKRSTWGSTGAPAVSLSVLGGIGAEYQVNENLHLRVEPIYRTMIPIQNNAPFRSRLVSFGTNFGVFLSM